MAKALCAEEEIPTDYFFDEYVRNMDVFEYVNNLCSRCEVSAACFNYGVNTKSIGVWGGRWLQYGQVVDVISEEGLDGDLDGQEI